MAETSELICPIIRQECMEDKCSFYVLTEGKVPYKRECAIIFTARKLRLIDVDLRHIRDGRKL